MIKLRKGTPSEPEWSPEDLAKHFKIDIMDAKKHFKNYHRAHNNKCYDDTPIPKHLIIEFVENFNKEEEEKSARHLAALATVEQTEILRNQVRELQDANLTFKHQLREMRLQVDLNKENNEITYENMVEVKHSNAVSSRNSIISIVIAGCSLIVAILALCLKS